MQLRRIITALVFLGVAIPSFALTIGRPQGAIWIGKPVDLTVPLSLDATEGGDSLCLEAEVLQGDTRIEDKRVTVSLEPGPSAGTPRMRIRSTVAVDEPVVTVAVKAGCTTRSTRRFVLLADVPTDISVPGVTSNNVSSSPGFDRPVPNLGADASSASGGAVPSFGSAAAARASEARRAATRRRAVAQPLASEAGGAEPRSAARSAPKVARRAVSAAAKAPSRTAQAVKPSTAVTAVPKREPVPSGPRLQLDALELSAARNIELKASPSLAVVPSEDPAKRAEAAALWRAIGMPPEETQREAQRMQTLEATLSALREQTARNQRSLLEMRSELAEARRSRYSNPLVYSLVLLLLLALVGMLLLWRLVRRASVPVWWGEQPGGPDGGSAVEENELTRPGGIDRKSDLYSSTLPTGTTWQASPSSFRSAELEDSDSEYATDFVGLGTSTSRSPDGVPMRPVNTEELFDVQQQSDFFLSLGQHEQAIEVLSEHIADNPGTSALAYLDLLRIYHSLGRRDEYAGVRLEFVRAFNADVPEFDNFSQVGHGLEHYRSTLARITSQWPAPGTLALIEELVFRKPGAHEDEAFDLAAYQELLLLYSVAKEVIDPDSPLPAPATPLSFVDTFGDGQEPTVPLPIGGENRSQIVGTASNALPSRYGAIDEGLEHDTDLVPALPEPPGASWPDIPADRSSLPTNFADFETMPAAIAARPAHGREPSSDPNIIDFDLFDPATEAEIAPKTPPRKR